MQCIFKVKKPIKDAHYLDVINMLSRRIASTFDDKVSLLGNASDFFRPNTSLTEEKRLHRNFTYYTEIDDIVEQIMALTERNTRTDTLNHSSRFLGSLFMLSPGEGDSLPKVHRRLKPLYRAVVATRMLDALIENGLCESPYINKVLKGSGRYGQDKDGNIIFNEYVTRPFLFAVLAMDCGLEHPESRDLLSGLEGNKDEFRILNEKERSRLLNINEKHSRDFLKNAVLHQRDRFLKTRKAYRKDQCERFNDFCLQIYDSIYDYSSLIGNSAKASQIYASVVMCTKREYRKLEAVQATKIIKEHVRRRDINIKVATIFFKLFGSFPQGFGIACILGDHYKSSTPFEYAIVNRLYPDDVNSPHCRIVTRSLSFDLGVRDMVITPEMNLLFPQGRNRVGKRLSDNVKAALVKLSGRKITDADEMLVPKFWEPHTIYASRKFSIWNGLNYDGKSAADKPTNTADTA